MADLVLFHLLGANFEWNRMERNGTHGCQSETLVIGGIYDFDVFGS